MLPYGTLVLPLTHMLYYYVSLRHSYNNSSNTTLREQPQASVDLTDDEHGTPEDTLNVSVDLLTTPPPSPRQQPRSPPWLQRKPTGPARYYPLTGLLKPLVDPVPPLDLSELDYTTEMTYEQFTEAEMSDSDNEGYMLSSPRSTKEGFDLTTMSDGDEYQDGYMGIPLEHNKEEHTSHAQAHAEYNKAFELSQNFGPGKEDDTLFNLFR